MWNTEPVVRLLNIRQFLSRHSSPPCPALLPCESSKPASQRRTWICPSWSTMEWGSPDSTRPAPRRSRCWTRSWRLPSTQKLCSSVRYLYNVHSNECETYSTLQDGGPIEVCRALLALRNYQWWAAMISERGEPANISDVRVSRIVNFLTSEVRHTFSLCLELNSDWFFSSLGASTHRWECWDHSQDKCKYSSHY